MSLARHTYVFAGASVLAFTLSAGDLTAQGGRGGGGGQGKKDATPQTVEQVPEKILTPAEKKAIHCANPLNAKSPFCAKEQKAVVSE